MNVSAFPLYRRRGVVDDVVRGLSAPAADDAQRFWREKSTALMRDLVASGVPLETAKAELRMLLRAVFAQLRQRPAAGMGG